MRLVPVVLLAAFALVAALPARAQRNCVQGAHYQLCGTERRLTTNDSDQFDAGISGNIVVYTDFRRGVDADIWFLDLATGVEAPVVTGEGDQQLTDVSNGRIVYTDFVTSDVLVFDAATGTTRNLTHEAGSISIDPAIGGGLVAWTDNRDCNFEIYALDLATGVLRRISDSPSSDERPAVGDGAIAWQRCNAMRVCDIFAYDWATGVTRQVTDTPLVHEEGPAVSGNRVMYSRHVDPYQSDICIFDLGTNLETCLSLPGYQVNPHMSGDWVSMDDLADVWNGAFHTKLWHLPSGEVFDLSGVPGGPPAGAGQFLNDIDGNRVVYTDDRGGQLEIYLFEFELSPLGDTTPPTLILPRGLVTDATSPAGAPVAFTVTATDAVDPAPVISCAPPSGSTFAVGTTNVSCTATDASGNVSAPGTFTILVRAAAQQVLDLLALVDGLNLKHGIENSLDAKLQNAEAALAAANAGNRNTVCGLMSAFVNETTAQAGMAITTEDAGQLIVAAARIRDVLACP